MRERQVCFRLPAKIIDKLEAIRELTSMPISDLIKLLIAGYRIVKIDTGEEILGSTALFG